MLVQKIEDPSSKAKKFKLDSKKVLWKKGEKNFNIKFKRTWNLMQLAVEAFCISVPFA